MDGYLDDKTTWWRDSEDWGCHETHTLQSFSAWWVGFTSSSWSFEPVEYDFNLKVFQHFQDLLSLMSMTVVK